MARILVVDLEESVRRTLCNLLHAEGHEAVEAGDAEEAPQLLSKGAFDVVVTDINLPRTSGLVLLRRIRASSPSVQVVTMTGMPTVDTAIESFRAGAADYLVKPISKEALLRSVDTAIQIKTRAESRSGQVAEKLADLQDLERLVDERTEALRDSEERYRALFDRSLDCVFLTDFDGHFLDANQAAFDLLGYEREDLATVNFESLLTPDQLPLAMQVLEEVRTTGRQKTPTEFRLHRRGSGFVIVETQSSLIYRHGRPYAVQGIARDVTERRRIIEALRERTAALETTNEELRDQIAERQRSEAALKQSEQRIRTLVETSPDAIILLDPQARILMVNQRGAAIFGFESVVQAIGRDGLELFPSSDRQRVAENLQRALTSETVRDLQFTMARLDGSTFSAEISATTIVDDGSEPTALLIVVRDITERQRLQTQFLQAQKMEAIGVLAGGVAHDFNNVLTVILGTAEILLTDVPEGDPHRQDLESIMRAAQKASKLTSQLLAFSRKQILQPRLLDLNAEIDDLGKMLRRLLGEDIDVLTICRPNLGSVMVDPGQVQQIIMNLAVNARDAMPEGGKLTIETDNVEFDAEYIKKHPMARPGRYVMLAVSDTGVGMDHQTQARAFEPFFTTKAQGKGTGLGLSTVYGIVKQSDGFIWVYSELRQGTTFKIYFPRVEAVSAQLAAEAQPAEAWRGTETILLVEDDESVRSVAGHMLTQQGYRVLEGSTAEEALSISAKYSDEIHLLITDVVMPRMSGKELANRISESRPGMKILYISGYTTDAIVHRGLLDSAIAFLQKPFTATSLVRKVREVWMPPTRPPTRISSIAKVFSRISK